MILADGVRELIEMAPKAAPAHPPYLALISEAITGLKERTGSSYPAIKKYIGAKHKLPNGWEKVLAQQLKKQATAVLRNLWFMPSRRRLPNTKAATTTRRPQKDFAGWDI